MKAKAPVPQFSKSKGRPDSMANPAHEGTAGPGEYYTDKPFDADAKPIAISKDKTSWHPPTTSGPESGPGAYNSAAAEKLTRPKSRSALINKTKRPDNFSNKQDH